MSGIRCIEVAHDQADKESGHRRRVMSVAQEKDWRRPVRDADMKCSARGSDNECVEDEIMVSRWTRDATDDIELSCESTNSWYTIGIALKSTTLVFRSGSTLFEGRISPGATQITAPGQSACAVFRDPCDVLHLHIPQSVLARHYEESFGRPPGANIPIDSEMLTQDVVLERLGMALCHTRGTDTRFTTLYVDGICLAMVARLLERQITRGLPLLSQDGNMLPLWRLRRALDYIEAHLSTPIRLADIAASAGLSRMHFAAQFRRATGYSPYAYLLRRRIEHAQALLRHSNKSILDIATDSGFNSQSSFTTAFRTLIGDTPHRWRTKA